MPARSARLVLVSASSTARAASQTSMRARPPWLPLSAITRSTGGSTTTRSSLPHLHVRVQQGRVEGEGRPDLALGDLAQAREVRHQTGHRREQHQVQGQDEHARAEGPPAAVVAPAHLGGAGLGSAGAGTRLPRRGLAGHHFSQPQPPHAHATVLAGSPPGGTRVICPRRRRRRRRRCGAPGGAASRRPPPVPRRRSLRCRAGSAGRAPARTAASPAGRSG